MISYINIFLRRLEDSSLRGDAVNMTDVCKRLAVDIVGYLAFGYELKTQTEVTNRCIPRVMGKAIYMTNLYYTWPALGIIAPLLRWLAKNKAETFHQAVHKMIDARMAEAQDAKPDFYASAAGEFDASGSHINDSELWSEALFFVTAGGTTVASALCGLLFNLSHHPEIYERVAVEIRSVFSSGHEIQLGSKLASCKYLRAVIDESLRLSPPSLTPLWRERDGSSTEPLVVDGHVVPNGTEVSVHLYSILHNSHYFPEPFAFRPERWLEKDDGAKVRRAQVSFGIGDRSCAGKSMAYMETSIAIARTLWYFDFSIAPGEVGKLGDGRHGCRDPWATSGQFQLQDILAADHDGPNLIFKLRDGCFVEKDIAMGSRDVS